VNDGLFSFPFLSFLSLRSGKLCLVIFFFFFFPSSSYLEFKAVFNSALLLRGRRGRVVVVVVGLLVF